MKNLFYSFVLMLVVTACTADGFTYSSSPCYLVIHNEIHMDATLSSAMNASSPGVFCLITLNAASTGYTFKNNQGLSSEKKFNEVDKRLTKILGMNNGLIVGFGTMTQSFLAFDRECPNCFDANSSKVVNRHLAMNEKGMAFCSVCKDTFDLNSGGICTNDKGRLTQYRCGTTGSYGTLSVGN